MFGHVIHSGLSWLGSNFTHEPGASAGWLMAANSSRAKTGKAAIKVSRVDDICVLCQAATSLVVMNHNRAAQSAVRYCSENMKSSSLGEQISWIWLML